MKQPHKHAALIKAWADGAEIEIYDDGAWKKAWNPNWYEACVYRIKPEPKPDVVLYGYVMKMYGDERQKSDHNIKITYCGETGKLKKAEVLE